MDMVSDRVFLPLMAFRISDAAITNVDEEQRLYLVHTNSLLPITVLAAHERKP